VYISKPRQECLASVNRGCHWQRIICAPENNRRQLVMDKRRHRQQPYPPRLRCHQRLTTDRIFNDLTAHAHNSPSGRTASPPPPPERPLTRDTRSLTPSDDEDSRGDEERRVRHGSSGSSLTDDAGPADLEISISQPPPPEVNSASSRSADRQRTNFLLFYS